VTLNWRELHDENPSIICASHCFSRGHALAIHMEVGETRVQNFIALLNRVWTGFTLLTIVTGGSLS
jgi:hypothetical protein